MSFRRPPRARLAALTALAVLTAVTAGARLAAQPPVPARPTTWAELAAAPGAAPAEVAWLRAHMGDAERAELAALVGALSAPAAAQAMGAYLHADGSVHVPFTGARALADSLLARPADGPAGLVRVAYLSARLRRATLDGWGRLGVFAADFADTAAATTPAVAVARTRAAAPAPGAAVRLRFDFAPAESLLAMTAAPDRPAAALLPRLGGPAFDALLSHRSQSFYAAPWTRELMAASLARATSTLPVDRLYAWANPKGSLDYGDVVRHRARYRALLDRLRAAEPALLGAAAARVAAFVPAGTRLDRTVSLYFADGADGWAADGVAAVDLEWFKDDLPRLQATVAHEAYHAAQDAARRPGQSGASPAERALRGALEALFAEGTADYVAPARARTAAERAAAVREGAAILDSLVAAGADTARASALRDRGVSGGGPFYVLGEAMSAAIVDAFGAPALAATVPGGGPAFARRYLDASARRPGGPALLTPRVAAAVRALRD